MIRSLLFPLGPVDLGRQTARPFGASSHLGLLAAGRRRRRKSGGAGRHC